MMHFYVFSSFNPGQYSSLMLPTKHMLMDLITPNLAFMWCLIYF